MKSQSSLSGNIAWVSVSNALALIMGFVSSILLARWLGPDGRGIYAIILTAGLLIANILGTSSWNQANAFYSGKKEYTPSQIAGHSLLLFLVCILFLTFPLVIIPNNILGFLIPKLNSSQLWLAAFYAISILFFGMLSGLLLGLDQIRLFTILKTGKVFVVFLLQLVLLGIFKLGLSGVLLEVSLTSSLILITIFAIFIFKFGIDLKIRPGLVRKFLAYSGKTYPGHIGVMLLSRMDIYFVALFSSPEVVGFYAVAKGLTEITAIIEQSISQAIIPKVIGGDYKAASSLVARAFRVSFWVNFLFFIVGGVVSPILIPIIYGQKFTGAVPAFLFLLPGALFLTSRILGTFFTMQLGRPEIPTYYILASGILSLPVSYLLTRQYGYLGTATAFSLVAGIRGLLAMILFIRYSDANIKEILFLTKDDILLLRTMIKSKIANQDLEKIDEIHPK